LGHVRLSASKNGGRPIEKGEPDLLGRREESTGHVFEGGEAEEGEQNFGSVPGNDPRQIEENERLKKFDFLPIKLLYFNFLSEIN